MLIELLFLGILLRVLSIIFAPSVFFLLARADFFYLSRGCDFVELWPVCYWKRRSNTGQAPTTLMLPTPNPTHPQTHSKLLLQRKPCRSHVEGQQNRLSSAGVCAKFESGDKHPLILTSLSPFCLSIYSSVPPSQLSNPVCFSSKGKLKPVGFVFLLLLAMCPLLKPRCWWTGNQKNMRWIAQMGGSEWRGVREGGWHSFDVFIIFGWFQFSNQLDSLSAVSQTVKNTFLQT